MVWLLKGPDGRNVLVDAGFHRGDLVTRWKPEHFVPPSEAVAQARREAGGRHRRDRVAHPLGSSRRHRSLPQRRASGCSAMSSTTTSIPRERRRIARSMRATRRSSPTSRGRGVSMLVDGDAKEIIPGITVYTGGQAHLRVAVRRREHDVGHRRHCIRQHVPLREPRAACADRADARRGIESARAGADGEPGVGSTTDRSRATIRKSSRASRRPAMA